MFESLVARHMESIRNSLERDALVSKSINKSEISIISRGIDSKKEYKFSIICYIKDYTGNNTYRTETISEISDSASSQEISKFIHASAQKENSEFTNFFSSSLTEASSVEDLVIKYAEALNKFAEQGVYYKYTKERL
ncbi:MULTISPECIES: hypothetical protein [Methylobacterium]|uniref:hypothetical protein n=1 Tax=Methylobacterium TaxID=407 RepID=UPI0013EA6804|nr:hypothetical protein [Methylobacterium sp. DB0501]NGM34048.1 hypothetical protein [Methylobacterium sp. DB0501]